MTPPAQPDPPQFADVAADPPQFQTRHRDRVMVMLTALSGGWWARWHSDENGQPVLRALFRWD